ncbi:MAG: SPW repeat domain-containing protein [Polyangiaceae bacterium]
MAIDTKPSSPASTPPFRRGNDSPRLFEILVCTWLVISAFAWPHTFAQMTNTWIVGVIGAVVALVGLFADARARYANTVLAVWLFISVFALPGAERGTVWNNVIVAFVLFLLSLSVPQGGGRTLRHA